MIYTFLRNRWPMLALTAVLSVAGPIVTLVILSRINGLTTGGLHGEDLRPLLIGLGWLAALLFVDSLSQVFLARLGGAFVAQLRIDISQRFIDLDFESLLNRTHLIADALVGDIWRIAPLVMEGPQIVYSAIFVLLCSIYLLVSSPALFGVLFVFLAAMVLVYVGVEASARVKFDDMRRVEGVLGEHYRSIGEGKKELSLNANRARHFTRESLVPTIGDAQSLMDKLHLRWGLNQAWSSGGLYAAIFTVVYIDEVLLHLPSAVLLNFVVGAFFLIGPVNVLLRSGPTVGRAMASLRHLDHIGLDMQPKGAERHPAHLDGVNSSWQEIRAEDLCYCYPGDPDSDRMIGPFNLSLKRGEMTFIVGGNGSGKSTLLLLLCGLLRPKSGRILIDGQPVDGSTMPYRAHFAGVFGDCHLFPDVLTPAGVRVPDPDVEALLRKVGLDARLSVVDGKLSSTALSTGQRKRLALVQCYAEDRDVNFFDEWAADQDPQFREHFYHVLLPELRRRGKTVLVISHDDRYFSVADRIIKLEAGLVISDISAEPAIRRTADAVAGALDLKESSSAQEDQACH